MLSISMTVVSHYQPSQSWTMEEEATLGIWGWPLPPLVVAVVVVGVVPVLAGGRRVGRDVSPNRFGDC